jgi:hypothetical protein
VASLMAQSRLDGPVPMPTQMHFQLKDIGRSLFGSTPGWFRDAYWWLLDRKPNFSIQIFTNNHATPWEIMFPQRDGAPSRDLLFLDHPVARWRIQEEGPPPIFIPEGRVAQIVPEYREEGDRIAVRDQVMSLSRKFHCYDAGSGCDDFFDLMNNPQGSSAVVHFFGHGEADPPKSVLAKLKLQDGCITDGQLRGCDPTLGTRCSSLVFLNACSIAAGSFVLDRESSWPAALMNSRFGAIIAPLWPIDPSQAADLTEKFFSRVGDGKITIGTALRDLRRENKPLWSTMLAYVYFGDVNARISLRTAAVQPTSYLTE